MFLSSNTKQTLIKSNAISQNSNNKLIIPLPQKKKTEKNKDVIVQKKSNVQETSKKLEEQNVKLKSQLISMKMKQKQYLQEIKQLKIKLEQQIRQNSILKLSRQFCSDSKRQNQSYRSTKQRVQSIRQRKDKNFDFDKDRSNQNKSIESITKKQILVTKNIQGKEISLQIKKHESFIASHPVISLDYHQTKNNNQKIFSEVSFSQNKNDSQRRSNQRNNHLTKNLVKLGQRKNSQIQKKQSSKNSFSLRNSKRNNQKNEKVDQKNKLSNTQKIPINYSQKKIQNPNYKSVQYRRKDLSRNLSIENDFDDRTQKSRSNQLIVELKQKIKSQNQLIVALQLQRLKKDQQMLKTSQQSSNNRKNSEKSSISKLNDLKETALNSSIFASQRIKGSNIVNRSPIYEPNDMEKMKRKNSSKSIQKSPSILDCFKKQNHNFNQLKVENKHLKRQLAQKIKRFDEIGQKQRDNREKICDLSTKNMELRLQINQLKQLVSSLRQKY